MSGDGDLERMIQHVIERLMAGRYTERHGLVTSYDPDKHLAKVTFQPEGQESGWLPIETGHIGNGFGIAIGLTPGSGQAGQGGQGDSAGGSGGQGGQGTDTSAPAGAGNAAAADTRPGGGLGTPLDPEGTNDPWAKYKWWILGGLGLLLAGGAGVMLKNGSPHTAAPAATGASFAVGPNALLAALKEELFAVETDRLQGRLSESEYVEQKTALEIVLRRALLRSERDAEASRVAGTAV